MLMWGNNLQLQNKLTMIDPLLILGPETVIVIWFLLHNQNYKTIKQEEILGRLLLACKSNFCCVF